MALMGRRKHHGPDVLAEFDRVCKDIVGMGESGVPLEEMPQATRVQGARCFAVGNSSQAFRRVVAPAAAGKGDGVEPLNDYQKVVQALSKVR